jgi:dissimilatory sulfite reductase related protein
MNFEMTGRFLMATIQQESVNLGDEGYLDDPKDWNENVARELAATEDIELTEEHWRVIAFMREFFQENAVAADARFVIKFIAEEMQYGPRARAHLFKLFPYGYVKQACKIAGMRRPRAWSTG